MKQKVWDYLIAKYKDDGGIKQFFVDQTVLLAWNITIAVIVILVVSLIRM